MNNITHATATNFRNAEATPRYAGRVIASVDGPLQVRQDLVRVIVVVEGINDIEFLQRISLVMHTSDPSLPNLPELEMCGELVFLPTGGAAEAWGRRLAPLHKREFHLLDHEIPPETAQRRDMVARINRRHGCQAALTEKRSLENYLHPRAINAAMGLKVDFGDFDPVAHLVAKHAYHAKPVDRPWELLSNRSHKRWAYRAKQWLNTRAVEHMTPGLLAQRDPHGEVVSWLRTIGQLAPSK